MPQHPYTPYCRCTKIKYEGDSTYYVSVVIFMSEDSYLMSEPHFDRDRRLIEFKIESPETPIQEPIEELFREFEISDIDNDAIIGIKVNQYAADSPGNHPLQPISKKKSKVRLEDAEIGGDTV